MTNAQMIHSHNNTTNSCMCMAFELSNKSWQLMFSNGVNRRQISMPARDLQRLETEIIKARHHFKLIEFIRFPSGTHWFFIKLQMIASLNIQEDIQLRSLKSLTTHCRNIGASKNMPTIEIITC